MNPNPALLNVPPFEGRVGMQQDFGESRWGG